MEPRVKQCYLILDSKKDMQVSGISYFTYAPFFDKCTPAAELLNSLARKHLPIDAVYGSLSEDLN